MLAFSAEFRIVGEVVNYKYLPAPAPTLFVDLVIGPAPTPNTPFDARPRVATVIQNDDLAGLFLKQCAIGDVIEASGSFFQSDYTPSAQGYVDTTFSVSSFQFLTQTSCDGSAFTALTAQRPERLH